MKASTSRIRIITLLSLTLAVFCLAVRTADALPQRPQPERLVNDLAGLLTPEQTNALENMLVAFDDSTSNQIAVLTVSDLEGYDPAEYATRTGIEWGVGSSDFNNGIVILVKPKTSSSGQVFIAVGYGLEGAVPDAYAKRIINNEMIPHFMNNDYYSGIDAACVTLMKLASGEISAPREYEEDEDGLLIAFTMLMIVLIAFTVAISIKNGGGNGGNGGSGGRNVYRGPIITIGNDFGGWSSSGSRGGFGGFGGGSFGGGGAGGSW